MDKRILLFVAALLVYVAVTGCVANASDQQKVDKADGPGNGLTTQQQNYAADGNNMHKSQLVKRRDEQRNKVNHKKITQPVLDLKSADLLNELLAAGDK
jgi:outer membrane murein-binding lipoprotein Lpp